MCQSAKNLRLEVPGWKASGLDSHRRRRDRKAWLRHPGPLIFSTSGQLRFNVSIMENRDAKLNPRVPSLRAKPCRSHFTFGYHISSIITIQSPHTTPARYTLLNLGKNAAIESLPVHPAGGYVSRKAVFVTLVLLVSLSKRLLVSPLDSAIVIILLFLCFLFAVPHHLLVIVVV